MADNTTERAGFVFSGRRGTLPLTDFICLYDGEVRKMGLRGGEINQRSAFRVLGTYLRGDPLKLYNREYPALIIRTELAPPQPAVIEVRERLEQFSRDPIPAILDATGNVIRPEIPALPYLPYRAPVAPREELPARQQLMADPLTHFYGMLRTEYRFQNPEQVAELMHFTRRYGESAQTMRSRMENLMEALPGLLTNAEAAQKFLGQFSYEEERRIQERLLLRTGEPNFTFQAAAQEAIICEQHYAFLDSRKPSPPRADKPPTPPTPTYVAARPSERGESNKHNNKSKPKQHAALAQTSPVATPPAGRRCHRCHDPNHLANACPQMSNMRCSHCQAKGFQGRGHTDRTCFELHPELRPARIPDRGRVTNVNQVATVQPALASTSASATPSPAPQSPSLDDIIKAVAAAFPQLRTRDPEFEYVGCALVPTASPTTDDSGRPVRDRQPPLRFRDPSPAADHNRAGRRHSSTLPMGHQRVPEEELPELPPLSETAEVLALLDTARLSLERAFKRVAVMDSRQSQPVQPMVPTATATAAFKAWADAEADRHFNDESRSPSERAKPVCSAMAQLHINATQLMGRPLMCYEERMMVDPQVPYLDTSNRSLALNNHVPSKVLVDTGAKPVLLSSAFAARLGLIGPKLGPAPYQIVSATETVEAVLGISLHPVKFVFSTGASCDQVTVLTKVLVTKAQDYDVLLGQDVLFQIGAVIDGWQGQFLYHPDYINDNPRMAAIPFIHPTFTRQAHRPCRAVPCHTALASWPAHPPLLYDSDRDDEDLPTVVAGVATPTFAEFRVQEVAEALRSLTTRATTLYYQALLVPPVLTALPQDLKDSIHDLFTPPSGWAPLRPLSRTPVRLQPKPDGYVVLDLFSGISTQLQACLRNGLAIQSYYAVETDQVAQTVAKHHIQLLHRDYPHLLPASSTQGFQTTLTNDIKTVSKQQLSCLPPVDIVFAGWECQGHSSAGIGLGLADPRSSLFYELVRVLNILEDLQLFSKLRPVHPFAYVLENVASNFDRRQHIRDDFIRIQHYIGTSVVIDAARHGARAHRLRAFWTNLLEANVLHAANQLVVRDLQANVDSILDTNHRAQICTRADRYPFYPANEVGRPINALPTLVSYPGSYAFRNGNPGMVLNTDNNQLEEPNANERERAMGFRTHTTSAPNVTEAQRRRLLGQAIDLRCLTFLLSLGLTHQQAISNPHSDLNHLGGGTSPTNIQNQVSGTVNGITGVASDSNLVAGVTALVTTVIPEAMQDSSTDLTDLNAIPKVPIWKFGDKLTGKREETFG